MATATLRGESRSFSKPDEVRTIPRGKIELIDIGGRTIGRATVEPGWRWSTSVKPMVKTDSCQGAHFQYVVSGTMMVEMEDGTRIECRAGDVAFIPPGHDAWVVGNEPVVAVDFEGMVNYAKP